MPINWQDPTERDRLLAAVIASFDGKINCKQVAKLFGKGATYNTIEGALRGPKKMAATLQGELAAGGDSEVPPSPAKAKPRTPKKDGVKTGRITKGKKGDAKTSPVKNEIFFDDLDTGSLYTSASGAEVGGEGTMDDESV
ncbi:hypothetical protein K505DRAFT_108652 [Melanomma pulvis-pyrius CBS 109.77]|uniref:Uncharacterized protein n=1 Tax=Melanomma pulvis-pyrius CBS 109.77 TaxID=1314802 RepID=A0A6A6XPR9_9PLEO|nr:hypothetical protein K505DRAFT_108652 [Melanomma pulvis-pyrius CBS 109.77]